MKSITAPSEDFGLDSVLNMKKFGQVVQYIHCCVCLNILHNPVICSYCDALMCEKCSTILKISGKNCFSACPGDIRRPNRFIRDLISGLVLHCSTCDLPFKHIDLHKHQHSKTGVHGIVETIKQQDGKIKGLTDEIFQLRAQLKIYTRINCSKYFKMSKKELRKHLITNTLSVKKKMELYHSATQGDLEEFKRLIWTKKYPLLEEISCPGYFWTAVHYAMHYGKYPVISFIFNELLSDNLLESALKLESNDGRCPVLCLFKSNCLNLTQKEEIFDRLLAQYSIEITAEIKKEAILRKLDGVLKKHGII